MEKIIKVKISLDSKTSFQTKDREPEEDITSEVFDYLVEATEQAIKDTLNVEEDDFANAILENYANTLPEDFKGFKSIGFKVEVD